MYQKMKINKKVSKLKGENKMNIGEKITNLRKQKGLSQEELGEKLDVTRQTISKWELGQTSPDANKLTEIANFFGVSVNELTSDEEIKTDEATNNNKVNNNKKDGKTPTGIIILIIVLVVCLLGIIIGAPLLIGRSIFKKASSVLDNNGEMRNSVKQTATGIFQQFDDMSKEYDEFSEEVDKKMEENEKKMAEAVKQAEERSNEFNKKSFNNKFEMYAGTKYGSSIRYLLDDVVTNNKTNNEKTITVVYKDKSTTVENEIVNIKHGFDIGTEYEVSLSYDQKGYVTNVTIMDI